MECKGICYDGNVLSFKVICHGTYSGLPHKLIMTRDGNFNKEYNDICQEPVHYAKIGYWILPQFEMDSNGNMVKLLPVRNIKGIYPYMSYYYQILEKFFHNYNVVPKWYNATYPVGGTDEEIANWTNPKDLVYKLINNNFWFIHRFF